MIRSAIVLSFLAGCTLFHGDHGDRVNDAGTGDSGDSCDTTGPQILLVNPATLACQSFFGTSSCDPLSCDHCPDVDAGAPFIPQWGSCQSSCLGLTEQVCATTQGCRVSREANLFFGQANADSYLGCYPISNEPSPSFHPACTTLDANACSSDARCTTIYYAPDGVNCPIDRREACPGGTFAECIDATVTVPGVCLGPDAMITCATPPPACTGSDTPGYANGCYTGACIPPGYCPIPID